MMKQWLENLKPGDPVILRRGYGGWPSVAFVERITKTMVMVKGTSTRFSRKYGDAVGEHGYHSPYLEEGTPEKLEKIKKEERRRDNIYTLNNVKWKNMDDETLESFIAALKMVQQDGDDDEN